ncbi:MAG: tripartite tricarboxylate transporter TctB family protein [Deltaproteobacteria bacterium]|nr:tripartite tricarboxylate transporter TctB family protein [Deltaproteobacteria bacterium]
MQRSVLGVNITALLLSALYLVGALGYPMGTLDRPGPGLYPLFTGILLVIASIGSLVTNLLNQLEKKINFPRGKDLGRVLTVIGGTIAYVLLLPYAGHLLASMAIVFIVLQTMGLPSWPLKIGFTIAIALGSFYLFDTLLSVPLPRGIFW